MQLDIGARIWKTIANHYQFKKLIGLTEISQWRTIFLTNRNIITGDIILKRKRCHFLAIKDLEAAINIILVAAHRWFRASDVETEHIGIIDINAIIINLGTI